MCLCLFCYFILMFRICLDVKNGHECGSRLKVLNVGLKSHNGTMQILVLKIQHSHPVHICGVEEENLTRFHRCLVYLFGILVRHL